MSLFVVVGWISECRSIFYRYTEYLRWTDVRSFNACPQTAVHSLLFVAKVVTCFFRNFNSNVDYKQNASNLLYSRSSMLFSNKCALKLFWLWLFVCHPNLQDYCYHCSPSEFIWIGLWKTEKERKNLCHLQTLKKILCGVLVTLKNCYPLPVWLQPGPFVAFHPPFLFIHFLTNKGNKKIPKYLNCLGRICITALNCSFLCNQTS